MPDFYSDHDRHAAAWLRELITAGHLPQGTVDERSIQEITGADLAGYRQVHLFAGIGGWPYALQLAGWPDDRPVWTGSCPCQPFSAAGKRKGGTDERHLWPAFFRLIRECKPATIFGEQVGGRAGYDWLARVSADLESQGYRVGAADLPAACVGAPHIRQRLFWVADAGSGDGRRTKRFVQSGVMANGRRNATPPIARSSRHARRLANSNGRDASDGGLQRSGEQRQQPQDGGVAEWLGNATSGGCGIGGDASQPGSGGHAVGAGGAAFDGVDHTGSPGLEGRQRSEHSEGAGRSGRMQAPWMRCVSIPCADGKARRIEPGIFPLAHGIPGRVGLLRGAGNAIVPQVAAKFVEAFLQIENGV